MSRRSSDTKSRPRIPAAPGLVSTRGAIRGAVDLGRHSIPKSLVNPLVRVKTEERSQTVFRLTRVGVSPLGSASQRHTGIEHQQLSTGGGSPGKSVAQEDQPDQQTLGKED
jgi:hypothetical protein